MKQERGFTLVELIIAITLVAALSTGMLMAMRISLTTLEKTQARLESNRIVMGVEQTILRQIGGVMPVVGVCGAPGGPATRIAAFNGATDNLRFVSSYSFAQGFRGYPQIVEYQVVPAPGGQFRLVMNEHLYYGPLATGPLCDAGRFLPVIVDGNSVVLADHLAYCRFVYHERIAESIDGGNWIPLWNRPNLPSAVRVEMAPAAPDAVHLPFVSLHIPIHVTREVLGSYGDE